MKIALVCEGFDRRSLLLQPWHRVYAIAKRMAAKENFSVFIVSDRTPNSSELEEIDGITVTRVSRLALLGVLGKRALAKAVLKNDPDVVVWYGSPLSAIYLNRLRAVRKPIIWDIDTDLPTLKTLGHLSFRELVNLDHNLFLPQLMTIIYPKFVMKRVANSGLISRIIVPSQSLKNSLGAIGVSPDKIRVIPSTIVGRLENLDGKEDLSRSRLGFEQTEFIITYFGSPCTLRGTDTAVLSMQGILTSIKNVKLVILSRHGTSESTTGKNPGNEDYFENRHLRNEEDYLRKLVKRMKLDNNVRILPGVMDKSKLISYLLISDVIVLPFKIIFSEPPLSVLEAMKLGKVVVTANHSSLSEIVGNGRGILIGPSDVQALTRVILFLATHPEEAGKIRKRARDFAARLCDWDQVTLLFEELLKETVVS